MAGEPDDDSNRPRQSPDVRTSTRPSAFSHLLYDRGVRFAAGLAVVVAIPVAVLFYFQFRSLNDLEAASAVVLRQLSHDTADSLARDKSKKCSSVRTSICCCARGSRID